MSGTRHPEKSFAPWENPDAKPLVRFDNVTKRFGDFIAVDNLSIDIYPKEFFALLGPSGCGKTTLLRMLAGFEQPTEGRITLDGEDVSRTPPYERPVNMMFQSYALFPHMNVEKNIAFGLKQDGMPTAQILERVAEMLSLVQLEPFAKRKPHQLSGGQRQRVALARSLAKKPKLLLLDEPLGALDRKLREATQFELVNIQETLGVTFIIVTHDQEEAMTVADRIAVMDQGRMVQVAPPAVVYEHPNSRYVADFIGDVNLIAGRIAASDDDKTRLSWAEGQPNIRTDQTTDAQTGSEAWLAIRPEKVRISSNVPSNSDNKLKGVVWDIGYLGNVSTYHVKLADGSTIKAMETNASKLVQREITWEDEVWLSWPDDAGVVLTS